MVRAGVGIGGAAAALLELTGASAAAVAPSVPATAATVVFLGSEAGPAWLFAALLAAGAALQAAGMFCGRRFPVLLGAAVVVGAGVFDSDPALVVGQLALLAALWPLDGKTGSRPARGSSDGTDRTRKGAVGGRGRSDACAARDEERR